MAERGASAAAANAAQYAAAAQAYATAATGAAAGIDELKAAVASFREELSKALPKAAPATPSSSPSPSGTPRQPRTPSPPRSPTGAPPGAKSPWSDAAWKKGQAGSLAGVQRNIGALDRQRAAAKGAGGAMAGLGASHDKPLVTIDQGNKSLKLLAKNLGISKTQLRAPMTAGAIELTKLAMGIRGMAQLSMIEQRAGFQLRQLFKGVDAAPVIRAADRLSQVFNKSSVTGKALGGIFERSFNFIFQKVEALAPYVHAAFQGMVIAAQYLEIGWLKASIALDPLMGAIQEFLPAGADMETAGLLGGAAFVTLGLSAAAAAIPVLAVAAAFKAISAAVEQAIKLYREWGDLKKAQMGEAMVRVFGAGSAEANRFYGVKSISAEEAAATHAKFVASQTGAPVAAATNGAADGEAFADGVAKGAADGSPKVAAAGAALADDINSSFRGRAGIQSPSTVAAASARNWPAGAAQGIDAGAPAVQAASDRMVPSLPSTSTSQSATGTATITIVNQWPTGAQPSAAMEGAFNDWLRLNLRAISQALGRPVAIT